MAVNLGAVFDPQRLCYGCRHAWETHNDADQRSCDCCRHEAERRGAKENYQQEESRRD